MSPTRADLTKSSSSAHDRLDNIAAFHTSGWRLTDDEIDEELFALECLENEIGATFSGKWPLFLTSRNLRAVAFASPIGEIHKVTLIHRADESFHLVMAMARAPEFDAVAEIHGFVYTPATIYIEAQRKAMILPRKLANPAFHHHYAPAALQ